MELLPFLARRGRAGFVLLACGAALSLTLAGPAVSGQKSKIETLLIGTSALAGQSAPKEEAGLATLKEFIKEETGLPNEIKRQKDWQELAAKMAKGQLHVGVFEGFEYAWATEKYKELKPLALAVNVYRYPVVYVVVKKNNAAKDFKGLQGQSLSMPGSSEAHLRLFIEHQAKVAGKPMKEFFSKIVSPDNIDDAFDDVVDGTVQVAVADRAALEAFKRRKPGRFNQLRPVVESPPFPPPVVAYFDKVLDEATRERFRKGLLDSGTKEKGQTVLTLFRLTGFETPPDDFAKVLADTRKTYPPKSGS